MTRKKGLSGVRSGLAAAIDSDVLTPPEPTSKKVPARKKPTPKTPAAPAPTEAAGLRGTGRAGKGETIEKVTITLPSGVIRAADKLVFERKRKTRAYNRSALIQEALQAYLTAPRKD